MFRWFWAVFLLALPASAEDFVHLKNGGLLHGAIVEETKQAVLLDLGGGRIFVPRHRVRLIERGATRVPVRRLVTQRDEWFLVLHRDKVVGWRRVVETEGPKRVQVEERTVFFRPGGGDDVAIRRVETADRAGRPLEFLLMESYGNRTDVTSGLVVNGRMQVSVLREGGGGAHEFELPKGCVLALPAWSRFLARAEPDETRTITAFDPRRMRAVRLVLRRDRDAPAPGGVDRRPCRALSLVGDFRSARALYRPGEGALAVELNGSTLIAQRTTRERVELARKALAGPEPLDVQEALRLPFYTRPKDLTAYHPRTGFSIDAPDAGWIPRAVEADEGLVFSFEKIALFASLEVFVYPVGKNGPDIDGCLERALARLRLTATSIDAEREAERGQVRGLPVRSLPLRARHRGERLRCLLSVVRAKDRYLVLMGACPERWWRWAEKDFRAFTKSLVVVP